MQDIIFLPGYTGRSYAALAYDQNLIMTFTYWRTLSASKKLFTTPRWFFAYFFFFFLGEYMYSSIPQVEKKSFFSS